jgi:hypothetical protein
MKTFDEMDYHPVSEDLVQILCDKTQNRNPLFFRVMVAYYFSMVASMMRCKILTLDRGELPVNMFAINLSTSGSGKGYSTNIIEDMVIDQFRHNFTNFTFEALAQQNLPVIANARAVRKGTDPDDELVRVTKEFDSQGPLLFAFDSGTTPAVKQARQKLLMANAGSLNFQMDEMGSNLLSNSEVLSTFLELYDVGKVKQKLVKNTGENARHEEIVGRTPTNMMLFGTPSRLLNGGRTEEEFYAMLDEGYARRCFFGYARKHDRITDMTPQEILDQRTNTNTDQFIAQLSTRLGQLADMSQVGKTLQIDRDTTLLLIEYQMACEKKAERLAEHDEMRKAELAHRYFKALKLAGAYAFIDGAPEVTETHLYQAIKLAEESGKAFDQILTRDRPYVKLAKYIADVNRDVTQADLVEDLPFYKGNTSQKAEMMQLAIAYGYQNNIIIKKIHEDGVEFLRGETLKQTDLSEMLVSWSTDLAFNYVQESAPFEELHQMTQAENLHWATHGFRDGHRSEDNAIPGFNMVVFDVDHGVDLDTAKALLKDYKALFYTTKRHTDTEHRFRIVMPISYTLSLDAKDYKEFMANMYAWLPFEVDTSTGQRARKWMSHPGEYWYQDGELLDPLPFIPKTSKNEEFKQIMLDQQGMDNLERWVVNNTGDGNRNNMLLRYAMILVDAGFQFDGIMSKVLHLNTKLRDPLDEAEIVGTIMVSVGKAISAR